MSDPVDRRTFLGKTARWSGVLATLSLPGVLAACSDDSSDTTAAPAETAAAETEAMAAETTAAMAAETTAAAAATETTAAAASTPQPWASSAR